MTETLKQIILKSDIEAQGLRTHGWASYAEWVNFKELKLETSYIGVGQQITQN